MCRNENVLDVTVGRRVGERGWKRNMEVETAKEKYWRRSYRLVIAQRPTAYKIYTLGLFMSYGDWKQDFNRTMASEYGQ